MLRNRFKAIAIGSLVLIVIVVGWIVVFRRVNQALHPPIVSVRTVTASTGNIAVRVQETGTIQPVDKVDVRSKVAGRILTLPIQEGDFVHAGQLIATVDRTLLDPQLLQTEAQLSSAESRLQQAEESYRLQVIQTKMAISQAEAGVRSAKLHVAAVAAPTRSQDLSEQQESAKRARITLADSVRTLKRKQYLLSRGFVPQADVDAAQVAVDTAQSALSSSEAAVSLSEAGPRPQDVADAQAQVDTSKIQLETAEANALQNDVRRSDIAQARANVQQISGNLSQLQVQIGDTRIIAPASGIVLKRYRQQGEIVQSATTGFSDTQSIVATLGSKLQVVVAINEVDIARIRVGAPVTITVDALPNLAFSGSVTEIAPASSGAFPDSGSGAVVQTGISKFTVKVSIARYDRRLRPGMSANVSILAAQKNHIVTLPLEAIPFEGDKGSIMVQLAPGKTEPRNVVLGLRDDTSVEVVSGVKSGEQVVVPLPNGSRRTINIGGPNN